MLTSHFKCPKALKILMNGKSKSYRKGMYEAHQAMLNYKARSTKTDDVHKSE